jgi:class 3 adenylate cyclase/tetratricopeptide (TPR) repeat protein/tRNA A-37 threonylcarbamoyl transferase component Bud32
MELPAQFGRYQLLERIAAGGMAEVFLARSFGVEGFEKRLVIKRILPELAQNPRFVQMFVHEAKLSVSLSHPNIVQVFDLGKVGEDHYMAMEYIQGRDLTQVLRVLRRNGERLPIPIAVTIAAAVARGLAYAHARATPEGRPLHIVHRDVSPHNIMVSYDGDVKLVDFGIARLIEAGREGGDAKRPGGGKFAYMSPEQAAGKPLDHRSDIFSLGVVMFEMLAGRRLFADGDPDEKLRAVIACEVPDVRSFNPEVPDALRGVLARVLARDPQDRYADAAVLEEDLRALLFEMGFRGDAAQRATLMRRLFAEEIAGARGSAELEALAEDLAALHTGVEPEPEHSGADSHGTPGTHTPGGSDERAPRLLQRGERRSVVVLVAEVNGLTEVSARAESEDIARIHYRMLRMVRTLVDRMGGVAERFDDDTLLVFFGLPRALGDDLDRALSCARELHRLAARLRKRGISMEFSVGVHVGDLTVSQRFGKRFRYAARGDTLKSSVRLAYAAEPGTTLVSDRVAALAGDRFPFDRGPELRRKGARGTRPTFLLTGGRRLGVRGAAGRWFRRGDELEVLREMVAGLREGVGARVGIVGEAGIGKSRLFRELKELAGRRGIPVFTGRAIPFGDRPLAPFRDLVGDILGIHQEMGPAGIRERLERLGELHLEPADIAVIATLFAVDVGERREPGREAMFQAAARLIRGLAADGPVIVLMEDLHYLDPLERSLFEQLLRAAEGEPVLLLGSWRGRMPEGLAPLMREVALGPLAPEQAVMMAADLLGAQAVGPDLTRLVARTAEGNPLYLEEIIKALHQAGRIYFEGTTARLRDPRVDPGLPPTLQGLLAARIDALEPAARGALQVAAVIGLTFSPALLGAAVGADDPTLLIGELVRAGLIVPESRTPDTSYAFVSVLVWESVLRSILGIQRREYHRMVAAGMEQVHGERLEHVAEAYAAHCHAGGRVRDAALAVARAGDAHRRAQFLDRALECYLRGIQWLGTAPRDQQDDRLDARLHLCAGEVAVLLGRTRAENLLHVALDLVADLGPVDYEARAMLALGQVYANSGKSAMAGAHLDAALGLFRRLKDTNGQVRCLEALGALALDEGRVEDGRAAYEEGLRAAGEDRGLGARMLLGLASHALRRDDNAGATALLREAQPRAEAAGDRILLGRILNNIGIAHLNEGRVNEALEEFRRALQVRQGLGYRIGEVVNLHNMGDAWLRIGDNARAYASFEQSRELARECGWERGVVMNDAFVAYLRGVRGDDVGAELERASAAAQALGDREMAVQARWLHVRLLLARGEAAADRLARTVVADARAAGLASLVREMESAGL